MTRPSLRRRLAQAARAVELSTRPVHPATHAVLRRRWRALPAGVRGPEQVLGRHSVGCEGTHGVFPACNLTCSPCYHSADANQVRIDGEHTLREVTAQMALLQKANGPSAHAQLIGGEVSLLSPDDHAAALLAMRAAGREPMSMTHGDFDPAYLRALVTAPDGSVRLRRVSFAAHFDSFMRGRRGMPRPRAESDLHAHRQAFADMFVELRRRLGVRSFLAHNMTVTPDNLDQVADVVRAVRTMDYSMMSFQPAASVGDARRWSAGMSGVSIDDVWARVEAGMGQPLAWQGLQFGDPRCNRTAVGLLVGDRWVPVLDPASAADLRARDAEMRWFGGMTVVGVPLPVVAGKVCRAVTRHPSVVPLAAGWAMRAITRAGGPVVVARALLRRRVRPLTFVVHNFMDAAVVAPAWEANRSGTVSPDPQVRAAQERLAACFYLMAHPETGELVPACAQHSVLDPEENRRLRVLLPRPTVRSSRERQER